MSELEEAPSKVKAPRLQAKQRRPRRVEFVNRRVRGFDFCFTVMPGPRVLVPVEGPWVERMIVDVLPKATEVAGCHSKSYLQTWRGTASAGGGRQGTHPLETGHRLCICCMLHHLLYCTWTPRARGGGRKSA